MAIWDRGAARPPGGPEKAMKGHTVLLAGVSLFCWPLGALAEYVRVDPQQIEGMVLLGQQSSLDPVGVTRLSLNGNYLYCTSTKGLHTVDISDPADMHLTSEWDSGGTKMQDLSWYQNTLYAANWSPGVGLRIFSITNPADPSYVRTKPTESFTWSVEAYDGLVFVELNNKAEGIARVNIYDAAANPTDPPLASYVDGPGGAMNNAAKYQNYMYFCCQRWLYVYDIANPYNPTYVRRVALNAYPLNVGLDRRHNLYALAWDDDGYGYEGGLHSFSLADASNPQHLGHVDFDTGSKFFHIHDVTDMAYVIGGGSSIFTIDISDPTNMTVRRHWSVSWSDPYHAGWAADVTGAGEYIYVGTLHGTDANCGDFTCPWYGARVYAVKVAEWVPVAPMIVEVTPDPDGIYAGNEYVKQLTLTQGDPPITWSVVEGPAGLQVDQNGFVSGWTPGVGDIGTHVIAVQAANGNGSDSESWSVEVWALPDGTLAMFKFNNGPQSWSLEAWRSGSYEPGVMEWAPTGGNPSGAMRSSGSGATNNSDNCTREGGMMSLAASTAALSNIRVEFDVTTSLDAPPELGCSGSCLSRLLGGSCEDMLAISYSPAGPVGPWTTVRVLTEGADLPTSWAHVAVSFPNAAEVVNNPGFAVRLQWQFNTAVDAGWLDNISIHGSPSVAVRADRDRDGDIDQADFGRFQACYGGSGTAPWPGCGDFDLDIDGDVDQDDFSFFRNCLNGPEVPIDFSCEG